MPVLVPLLGKFLFWVGVDATLKTIATPIVPLSLVMIGLQLSLLPALRRLSQAITCLLIKMLFTPLWWARF